MNAEQAWWSYFSRNVITCFGGTDHRVITVHIYSVQVYSRQADCAHTAVDHWSRHVGVSDHGLLTELQTHELIDLQGLNIDGIVNQRRADQSE